MVTPEDWARAYLEQASADLRASHDCGEPSVRAMLLQMVLACQGGAASRWTDGRGARAEHAHCCK